MAESLVNSSEGSERSESEDEVEPWAFARALIPAVDVTQEQFKLQRPRAGLSNPESHLPEFWREQIRSGASAISAATDMLGDLKQGCDWAFDNGPVWSFARFGRTVTTLPDERLVLIGGEHEDFYDPNFRIYADVTVLDGLWNPEEGGVQHYIYPRHVFPPTDFHTATLLDDHILLIGSCGYQHARREGVTQVLWLNLADFSIQSVDTSGETPGWIFCHKATLDGRRVTVRGGKIEPGYRDNGDSYALDLDTMVWTRL